MLFVVFLGFNRAEHVRAAVDQFNVYVSGDSDYPSPLSTMPKRLVMVDACYPLPSRKEQAHWFRHHADGVGADLFTLDKNHGQTGNFNEVHKLIDKNFGLKTDDWVLYFDTDHDFNDPKWLSKMLTVGMKGGFDLVTCGCFHNVGPNGSSKNIAENQGREGEVEGIKYRLATWPGGWPVGLFSGRYCSKKISAMHDFYGGTEMDTYQHLLKNGWKGACLTEIIDLRKMSVFDPEYSEWKAATIALKHGPDFVEWLESVRPGSLASPK